MEKRLVRSRTDRMVAGVCSGVAAYLGVDPTWVRAALLILTVFNGFGLVVYLALWLLVPSEGSLSMDGRDQIRENVGEMKIFFDELVQRVRSAIKA